MTFREALLWGQDAFSLAGVDTPYLDALVLLSAAAERDKAGVYASLNDPLWEDAQGVFRDSVARRLEGLPVSYILAKKEFYGLPFYVDHRVLVPRPDTETLVEAALEILNQNREFRRLHDACTGSGCVALAVAAQFPPEARSDSSLEVSASDISADALEVFRINSRALLGRELPHYESDLLKSVPGIFDIITANPPYISSWETRTMKEARWPEPVLALDGGEEGLDLIRRLASEAMESLAENGYLLMEGGEGQAEIIEEVLRERGYLDLRSYRDLAGRRRVTAGRRGPGDV